VDFQLNVAKPVSLGIVLGGSGANLRLEALEDDDGMHTVRIQDFAERVATREGATALRVRLLNYLAEGAPSLTLDFAGVGVISSSFADETIGRLVQHFGRDFYKKFRMVNMSELVESLVSRAIFARSTESSDARADDRNNG
jgi:hypothetical protein